MKYEFVPQKPIKPVEPTYPMLGEGKTSGNPYIKWGIDSRWISLLNGCSIDESNIIPLNIGEGVILIQEGK